MAPQGDNQHDGETITTGAQYPIIQEARKDLLATRASQLETEIRRLIESHAVDEATFDALDGLVDHWLNSALAELRYEHEQKQAGLRAELAKAEARKEAAEERVVRARENLAAVTARIHAVDAHLREQAGSRREVFSLESSEAA